QATIAGAEAANDSLVINGFGGNDTIDASGLTSGFALTIDAGDGNDTIICSPGDGSDTIEGQAGTDTLLFNGSNAGEKIDISANGSRVRLFRDVGNVTMDLNGVEHVRVNASG